MDRDLVHRQTAATVVQHMALGVPGLGCEEALLHLLNYVWPNIFEESPHLVNGVMGAIDGCRLSLGPCVVLHYTLQVRGGRAGAGGRGGLVGRGGVEVGGRGAAAPHLARDGREVGRGGCEGRGQGLVAAAP